MKLTHDQSSKLPSLVTCPIRYGNVEVTVSGLCGQPISDCEVSLGDRTYMTNDSGKAIFSSLIPQVYSIEVLKKFEPHLTFSTHLPKNVTVHEPKVSISGSVPSKVDSTIKTKITLEPNFVPSSIWVYRQHKNLDVQRGIKHGNWVDYGHWWIKVKSVDESYGWWPANSRMGDAVDLNPAPPQQPKLREDATAAEKIKFRIEMAAFSLAMKLSETRVVYSGVTGILNGGTGYGDIDRKHIIQNGKKIYLQDPHHKDEKYDEKYEIILSEPPCINEQQLANKVRDFAIDYAKTHEWWSWRFHVNEQRGESLLHESGDNCHSFQIWMLKQCGFDKFREL